MQHSPETLHRMKVERALNRIVELLEKGHLVLLENQTIFRSIEGYSGEAAGYEPARTEEE